MDLIERYLQAVRFWLPRDQATDIINELSDELHAQIADQEAVLGRKLDPLELEAMLKRFGHPLLVAGRYLPQQQLISSQWFPLYYFALKAVLWVVLPLMAVISVPVAFTAADPVGAAFDALGNVLSTGIYIVGLITVIAVLVDRQKLKVRFLEDWRPGRLPRLVKVQDPTVIPRAASFGAFAGLMAFALWWAGLLRFLSIPDLHLVKALPQEFYWPVLALAAAEMLLHLVNLFLPYWTRRRAAARLVIDLGALALLASLAFTWPWFDLQLQQLVAAGLASAPHAADLDKIGDVVNMALLASLGIMALSYVLRALQDARRALGLPPLRNFLVGMFAN